MTKQVQRRRGTAAQHSSFTGAEGEISVNTTNKSVHVHDGLTAGGIEAARADLANVSDADLNTALSGNTLASLTITSADINGGTIDGTVIGGSTPAAISGTTGTFSGNLTVDTDTLFVDAANNRVGIGTTSPAYRLDVSAAGGAIARFINGSSGGTPSTTHGEVIVESGEANMGIQLLGTATSNQKILFGDTGSSGSGQLVYDHTSNFMALYTSASERVRINSSGNVGIGTVPDTDWYTGVTALQLDDAGSLSQNGGPGGRLVLALNAKQTGSSYITGWEYQQTDEASGYVQIGGEHFWWSAASGTADTAITWSERMRIDSSGKVGIGTSSPEGNLHVLSSSAGTVTAPASFPLVLEGNIVAGISVLTSNTGEGRIWFGDPDDNDVGRIEYAHSTNAMTFRTNASDRMVIDSSGNVGIGTSSPGGKLSVAAGSGDIVSNLDGSPMITYRNGSGAWFHAGKHPSNDAFVINSGATSTSTEFLRITNAGNVGIGTSSPGYKLTVAGYSNVASANKLAIGDNANYQALIYMESANETLTIENTSDYAGRATIFKDNGTERMRIDASGRLLIDCTATPSASVQGSMIEDYQQYSSVISTSARTHRFFINGNGTVGSISTSGSATSYNTSSDYRLKEDVQPMVGASDRLMALKPVNFAWKVDGSRVDGFIAHEAQEVVPEAVTGEKDAVDAEGNPEYQGIDQSKLVPLLTAALQEALTEIADLKARVAALEA